MTAQTGDTIDIPPATYHVEAFLDERLDSIAAQTQPDWRLIARDDGSTDRTPEILDAFRTRHLDRVMMVEDGAGNLGLVRNLSGLMERDGTGIRHLRDRAAPISDEAVVHDWWIAARVSTCGKTTVLDRPTVLYRQHVGNEMSAVPYHKTSLLQRIRDHSQHYQAKKDDLSATYRQAEALRDHHKDRMAKEESHLLERLLAMRDHNILWRLWECRAFDLLRGRPLRTLAFEMLNSRRRPSHKGRSLA